MNACRSPGPLALRLAPLSLWERLEVGAIAMSIITRYVHWVGHDAGGTLPPLDALAPAYHYLWRVSHAELRPLLNAAPLSVYLQPYRPPRLPISACNPSLSRQDWKRMARQNEVSEVPESSEFQ